MAPLPLVYNGFMALHRIFAFVGIVFGTVFVFVNAAELPDPWHWIARAAGAILLVVALIFGVIRARSARSSPDARSARVYWISVGAEVVAIPLGSLIITNVIGRPELTVVWVVFVVGAHFLPARAFGFGEWAWLGAMLIVLAVGGAVGTLVVSDTWGPAAAVLAGLALLTFSSVQRFVSGATATS